MHRRFRTAASALVLPFLALVLFTPGGAQAATVTAITADTPGDTQQQTLNYQAAPGEANDVVITTRGGEFGGWLVSDILAPLTAGAGCTSLDAHTASCPPGGTELNLYVQVDLGDSNDWASVVEACTPINYDFNYPCHPPTVDGGSGDDTVFGSDAVPSILHGGPGDDTLHAGTAGATLDGGAGADRLIGSAAKDVLIGGAGNDTINGGRGRDNMSGGAGSDTFYAKDGYRDHINGGAGTDQARIDRGRDTTRNVEHVHG
jgi:Ca2+-binding RTX toxin-like protein